MYLVAQKFESKYKDAEYDKNICNNGKWIDNEIYDS